jgi:hypothetical protein
MPQLQVKKAVAVCFLEAAKLTLEQLGAWRLDLSQRGALVPADVTRLYADVRRVRDYLQRCSGGYGEHVDIDIDRTDAAVLVACCRRAVDDVDRLIEKAANIEDRQALEKKHQLYGEWIVQLADRPIIELPMRREHPPSEATRTLLARMQEKVFGEMRHRAVFKAPHAGGVNSTMLGVPSFGDQVHDMGAPQDEGPDKPARSLHELDAMLAGEEPEPEPVTERRPDPDAVAEALAAEYAAVLQEVADEQAEADASAAAAPPPLFDHRKLRDPRLRALVGFDLGSYERAVAANDYRIATVMMASVLEAALLDHAIPRRAELALTGTPDGWNLQDVLLRALGEQAAPKDGSLGSHLFASRRLLHPAVQLVAPTVVTVASFVILRDFVQRALHGLGYGAPVEAQPLPPADRPGCA